MKTIIDITFEENNNVLQYLNEKNEVSYYADLDDKLKKMLVLSIASYFEKQITDMIYSFVHKKTDENVIITSFVQKKAISRQYHTFFDWKKNNCNSFLGLFGEVFKKEVQEEIKDRNMNENVKAFLELGELRNNLVHQNAATFIIEKTSLEIYEQYKSASNFIDLLKEKLN